MSMILKSCWRRSLRVTKVLIAFLSTLTELFYRTFDTLSSMSVDGIIYTYYETRYDTTGYDQKKKVRALCK